MTIYRRTTRDDLGTKLFWEQQFLSEILCQSNIKIDELGVVKQRLKNKKILIVLNDVDDLELLKTLVGKSGWFGYGSRIIVITQDRQLLKSHDIDLVYEVDFPSKDLALQMFCRSAFGNNSPPDGFMELAIEIAKLSNNLPLGLNVLGSSLKGKQKEEWMEMLPRLRNGLDGKTERTLRVSYDGLDCIDQDIFLHIACLLNGHEVNYIKDLLGDIVKIGLQMLVDRSLICIMPSTENVQMHNLLQKLGRKIVRAESIYNPGKRRFLVDAEDICDVFTDNTGTENVLSINFDKSDIKEPLFINEKSFKAMPNLRFIKFYQDWSWRIGEYKLYIRRGLIYLPRKLRLLHWDICPLKCMPSNFRAEYLIDLTMMGSELEMLWEGIQPLRSLKKMDLSGSIDLKEIPDLSFATDLEVLELSECTSLVTLPSSIRMLWMGRCTNLQVLPTDVDLESLVSLDLDECSRLRSFPQISINISRLYMEGTTIEDDCIWIENFFGLTDLIWTDFPMNCMPSNFCTEYLQELVMPCSKLEKLWEGVQPLGNLWRMDLSGSENLKKFPDLSKASNLKHLFLNDCKSLVMLLSSIQKLDNLEDFSMERCTRLEVLPTGVNLESLSSLNFDGCSRLTSFPQISTSLTKLSLDYTDIEEVPHWIEDMSGLTILSMGGCKKLTSISLNIFKLQHQL